MPIEKTFRQLNDQLCKLRDLLSGMQLTIREDAPKEGAVVLVDKYGDAVDDLLGWLEEALAAAAKAQQAIRSANHLEFARKQLITVHELFQKVQRRFQSDLVSYEQLKDLTRFGRSRRGEWATWTRAVKEGLERCRVPLEDTTACLVDCWQEIAERGIRGPVYIQEASVPPQTADKEEESFWQRSAP
jgi:hypothetical protein